MFLILKETTTKLLTIIVILIQVLRSKHKNLLNGYKHWNAYAIIYI